MVALIVPATAVPAPGTNLIRLPTTDRPAVVAAAVAAIDAAVERSIEIPYVTAIDAIIPSWMGTRRAASEKGVGEAPAAAAAPVASLIAASARSCFRSKSICCAAVIAWATPEGAPRKGASGGA